MAFPIQIKEQPGIAVDGIVTDHAGDCWVLLPGESHWRKVTREQMQAAIDKYIERAFS